MSLVRTTRLTHTQTASTHVQNAAACLIMKHHRDIKGLTLAPSGTANQIENHLDSVQTSA